MSRGVGQEGRDTPTRRLRSIWNLPLPLIVGTLSAALAVWGVIEVNEPGASSCRRVVCRAITIAPRLPPGAPVERVGRPLAVRPLTPGFLGLSIEYYALAAYTGNRPGALDPVFLDLVRQLNPGQAPVLRIGGDSADWAWVPARGLARPAGVRIRLNASLLRVLGALGRRLDARLILDLNLEAADPAVARAEALSFSRAIDRRSIGSFEIGNEPELYSVLPWYTSHGHPFFGRDHSYSLADYTREFDGFARRLPAGRLAGPSSGAPAWAGGLGGFITGAARLGMVTIHRYPLQRCNKEPGTPLFPTIPELLAPQSSTGLAASVIPEAASAHAHGRAIRVDEINSVACYGARGVSDTFASALWALEASFAMARIGVDGVNFHTLPQAVYGLFTFSRRRNGWSAHVAPDYYGLLSFARSAPVRSRLLSTRIPAGGLPMWATARGHEGHVVLINPGRRARTVGVIFPGAAGAAGVAYLRAPALSSSAVTLDGRTFGSSTKSGVLPSSWRPLFVRARRGVYAIRVPGPGAALLTLRLSRRGG